MVEVLRGLAIGNRDMFTNYRGHVVVLHGFAMDNTILNHHRVDFECTPRVLQGHVVW